MKNIMNFFGFGQEQEAIAFFIRFLRNPFLYLSDSRDERRVLVSILTLIWRFMLAFRFIDIFILKPGAESWDKIVIVIIFLLIKQIAQLALWFNGYVINFFVRLFTRKNDVLAAQRAYAFGAMVPNPILYVYTIAPLLRSIVNPIIATFIFYGLCLTGGITIWCVALARQYRLSIKGMLFISIPPVLLTAIYVFQIPFYLLVTFSPQIVTKDVDLNILKMKEFKIDSSIDGANHIKESLLQSDTNNIKLIDSLFKANLIPDSKLASELAEEYIAMAPLLASTYFNKRDLDKNFPNFPTSADSAAIDPKYSLVLGRYFKCLVLYARSLCDKHYYDQALAVIGNTLKLTKRVGDSNMGLCCAVAAVHYSKKICEVVDSTLTHISDPYLLSRLAITISNNWIDPEWTLNALRQEYYQTSAVESQTSAKVWKDYRARQDSVGFYVPDYTFKKFYDPEDTREIHSYIWARILKQSYTPSVVDTFKIPEIEHLMKGRFFKFKLYLFKNTIGRILVCIAIPKYSGYAYESFNTLRYMEFIYCALQLRANQIRQKALARSIKDIFLDTDTLEYKKTMCLLGDTLMSIDTTRFKTVYKKIIKSEE